jgi:uncharacterized integral membrane protein (TIGR00698 family)
MTRNETDAHDMKTWEKNLFGVRFVHLPQLLPGLLAVSFLTWLSIWLSNFIGEDLLGFNKSPISPVMIAVILGLSLASMFTLPKIFDLGLKFSVKKLLRFGIILLGIRLTIFDVFKLGAVGVPIVAICIVGALLLTTWINKILGLPQRLGTLIAVGTSICGVTAIVATSPVIDANEEESAYAVAVITIFGLFATLVYPYLANFIFAGNPLKAGLFIGTAVHETAQVVGAAKIYADIFSQPLAMDIATVAKLVRNVFMILVIPFMAYYYARQVPTEGEFKGKKANVLKLLPMFIFGFLAMATFRSIGDAGINSAGSVFGLLTPSTWNVVIATIKSWAEILLVVALAGVGLGTNFRSIKALGIKPFIVGLGASLSVGLVSYIAITILGGFVTF